MQKTRKSILFSFLMFFSLIGFAQDSIPKKTGDIKYREDQFYIGMTYNLILSNTENLNPEGLSGGVNFGFIRDMPINEKRNISIGVGVGATLDQYGSSLKISKNESDTNLFTVLSDTLNYKYNRFQTAVIEVPIQFRWRTSTSTSYKFWRAYVGFNVGYTIWYRSRFKDDTGSYSATNISEYDKLRLGTTLSAGYNKFNFYVYYSLNPFYKDAITTDGQKVDFKTLKLGLVFYIL